MTALLDTGFLLAVLDADDRHHSACTAALQGEREPTPEDLERTAEILEKYADSKVDFVDCAIVAIAERLKVQRILTVDRRHFGLFRPVHCQRFSIVP